MSTRLMKILLMKLSELNGICSDITVMIPKLLFFTLEKLEITLKLMYVLLPVITLLLFLTAMEISFTLLWLLDLQTMELIPYILMEL